MSLIKPIYLLIVSGLIWFIAFITLPASYINFGGKLWFPIISLILFNISFVLGLFTIKSVYVSKKEYSFSKKIALLVIMFVIGLIGVLIRMYQRIYIQEIYFAENLVETRMELMSSEVNSGFLGILSAVFYPFSTITLMLAILWHKHINKLIFLLILILGLFPIYDAFLTESRLLIVLTFLLVLFTFLASRISFFKNHTIIKVFKYKLISIPSVILKKKVWIPVSIIIIVFAIFSQKVVNNRLAAFGYTDTLKVWEHYHESKIDKDFNLEVKNAKSVNEKNKLIAQYSLKHYFAHSIPEYIRLNNHLQRFWGYYFGAFEFYTFIKFFKVIGLDIPSFSKLNEISYKPAVYTTFWGPFYIDFGVFGFFISFLLGRFTQRTYLRAKHGSEKDILLYAFIGVVVLASFFVNFAMGGNLYFLTAIIIAIILLKIWPNKIIIKRN